MYFKPIIYQVPWWSKSYGRWIYNYIWYLSITTIVVSSNPSHDEVYTIQQYVIKFVSNLAYTIDIVLFNLDKHTKTTFQIQLIT